MVFLIIRIAPLLLPVFYFLILESLFYFPERWPWLVVLALLFGFAPFFLMSWRLKDRRLLPLFLHSVVFTGSGLAYVLLISSQLLIQVLIIGWSLVYFIYLESIFNYLYETERALLIDLRHIIGYVNLVTFFILFSALIYYFIFLNFAWWGVLLIGFAAAWIMLFNRFMVNDCPKQQSILFAVVLALILTEITAALMFWPVSFYVFAMLMAAAYYLMSSLSVWHLKKVLNREILIRYLIFTFLVIGLTLGTAAWF